MILGAGQQIEIASAAVKISDTGDEPFFASIVEGLVEPIEPEVPPPTPADPSYENQEDEEDMGIYRF